MVDTFFLNNIIMKSDSVCLLIVLSLIILVTSLWGGSSSESHSLFQENFADLNGYNSPWTGNFGSVTGRSIPGDTLCCDQFAPVHQKSQLGNVTLPATEQELF